LNKIKYDFKSRHGAKSVESAWRQPKLKMNSPAAIALTVAWGLAAVILISGCGQKGPPEPPSGKKPPAVRDLRYSISATTINLSWTVPATTAKAKSPVAGFLIYRNQQPAFEEECPNCPVIFKQIGDVPSPQAGPGAQPLVYQQTLEPGYRYIFKVRAYDDEGLAGRDSNLVQFDF
jgi:hypothetical protein